MAIQPRPPEMSLAEFLAWVSDRSTKYEYARGVVLAMAGPVERAVFGHSETAP